MIRNTDAQNGRVVVLGGSGRLGRMLRHYWPQASEIAFQSRAGGPGYEGFDLLADPDRTVAFVQHSRAVVCLSGLTPAHAAAHGGDMSLNTDLARAAIKAASRAGVPRVFLASSAAVYGAGGGPFSEGDALRPLSDYGLAKAAMERAGQALAAQLRQPVTSLRIGNVAGADAILGNWRPGMEIDQLPDGTTPRRSYIGPATFARTLHDLSGMADLPPVLNLAAPGTVAMGDLLDHAGLAWTPRPAPQDVIARVDFDTKALEQRVAFSPQDSNPAQMVAQWTAMKEQP